MASVVIFGVETSSIMRLLICSCIDRIEGPCCDGNGEAPGCVGLPSAGVVPSTRCRARWLRLSAAGALSHRCVLDSLLEWGVGSCVVLIKKFSISCDPLSHRSTIRFFRE